MASVIRILIFLAVALVAFGGVIYFVMKNENQAIESNILDERELSETPIPEGAPPDPGAYGGGGGR
jgi:hypothetical protein